MNAKKLVRLILLAGVAALLIAGYLIWSALVERSEEPNRTVLFQADDIASIESSFSGEEQVFLKEQGVWVYAEDAAFPLNTAYIEDMEDALRSIVATGRIESDDLAEYGLATPAFEIKATAADGSEFACAVGDENETANVVYIRVNGGVYTLDIGFSKPFAHTLLEMVQKQPLLNLQPSEVKAISLTNGNGTWTIARDASVLPKEYTKLTWVRDDGVPADAVHAKALIQAISAMRAEETVSYRPDEAMLKQCGLSEPAATIRIEYGETSWTAQIGNKTEDGFYYIWLPEAELLSTFEAAVPEQILNLSPKDVVNLQVFPVEFGALTDAVVEYGEASKQVDFAQDGSAWDFYYALSNLRAERLAENQPAGDADVTITVHSTEPNVTYVLAFRKYNEDFYSTDFLGSIQLVNKRDVEELLNILGA